MITNNLVVSNLLALERIYKLAKKTIDATIVSLENKGVKNESSFEDLNKFSTAADNLIKNKIQTKFYS